MQISVTLLSNDLNTRPQLANCLANYETPWILLNQLQREIVRLLELSSTTPEQDQILEHLQKYIEESFKSYDVSPNWILF